MTESLMDCLSEFQRIGIYKAYQIMHEGKIPEFNAKVVLPTSGMEEYGLAIKFSIVDEYPNFWIYQESYQFYIDKDDEYGKTVEKIDTNDDLQELTKLFLVDLRNHFSF